MTAQKVINAIQYVKIELAQGPTAALAALRNDLGSKQRLKVSRVEKGLGHDGQLVANIPDLNVWRPESMPLSGTMAVNGYGKTREGATTSLLRQLLDPEVGRKRNGVETPLQLCVGDEDAPHSLVTVVPFRPFQPAKTSTATAELNA
ncbi:MAG: hypothetical protein WDO70_07335 [Alphaproteobacteria bacterium]